MTPRPFQPARNGSLKLLREVVQSAMLRRKGSNRAQNSDSENDQGERLLTDDNEEILVGRRRELEVENSLEYEDKREEEYAEDEYGSDEYEEDEDGDGAYEEANDKEDQELRDELEEWGENHSRLGEEKSETKATNPVEGVDRVGRMERPFNVWQW